MALRGRHPIGNPRASKRLDADRRGDRETVFLLMSAMPDFNPFAMNQVSRSSNGTPPVFLAASLGLFLFFLPLAHVRAGQSILAGLCLLIFAALWLSRIRPLSNLPADVAWPLVAWTLVATLSSTWSHSPLTSLSLVGQNVWMPAAFFLMTRWVARDHSGRRWATRGLIAGWAVLAFSGLGALALDQMPFLQSGNASGLADSPLIRWYPGPGLASTFVLLALVMLYWMGRERLLPKVPAALLALSLTVVGAISVNRMFWPCMLIGVVALILPCEASRHRFMRGWRGVLLAFVVCGAGILLVLSFTAIRNNHTISSSGLSDAARRVAQDPRFKIWKIWIDAGKQNLVLGTGFGKEVAREAYAPVLKQYPPTELDPAGQTHPHNVFVSVWVQTGFPGLICFAWLCISLTRHTWRLARQDSRGRHAAAAALALVCVLLVKNLTDDFYDRIVAIMFWAYLGLLTGYATSVNQPGAAPR